MGQVLPTRKVKEIRPNASADFPMLGFSSAKFSGNSLIQFNFSEV